MSNFIASQTITVQGLCETLKSTDSTDYVNSIEGYTLTDVDYKIFTFRNSSGAIIKQETVPASVFQSSVAITLLTFGTIVELSIRLKSPINLSFGVQNTLNIACLGI